MVFKKTVLFLGFYYLLISCATMTPTEYYKKLDEFTPGVEESSKKAISFIQDNKNSMYGSKEKVLYLSDIAMTHMRYQDNKNSLKYLRLADRYIENKYKGGLKELMMSYAFSEEQFDYVGTPMEHIQLVIYRSLLFAEQEEWETAAAMGRRANVLIKENVRKLTEDHGTKVDVTISQEKGGKILWHYIRDALSDYVASVAYFQFGDEENSLVAARKSVQTYHSTTWQKAYKIKQLPSPIRAHYCSLARSIDKGRLRAKDKKIFAKVCQKENYDLPKGQGRVVVLQMHGLPATKKSISIDIPLGEQLIFSLVGGIIGGIWAVFSSGGDQESKASAYYKVMMGLMLTNPFLRTQVLFQAAEIQKTGEKGGFSVVMNILGSLNPNAIRVSVPITFFDRKSQVQPSPIMINKQQTSYELAHNLDLVRERETYDTMNMAMLRSLSRGLIRLAISHAIRKNVHGYAALAWNIASKAVESADTRSLRSLPAQIYLHTKIVPADTPILVKNGPSEKTVTVKSGKTSFVVIR